MAPCLEFGMSRVRWSQRPGIGVELTWVGVQDIIRPSVPLVVGKEISSPDSLGVICGRALYAVETAFVAGKNHLSPLRQ